MGIGVVRWNSALSLTLLITTATNVTTDPQPKLRTYSSRPDFSPEWQVPAGMERGVNFALSPTGHIAHIPPAVFRGAILTLRVGLCAQMIRFYLKCHDDFLVQAQAHQAQVQAQAQAQVQAQPYPAGPRLLPIAYVLCMNCSLVLDTYATKIGSTLMPS